MHQAAAYLQRNRGDLPRILPFLTLMGAKDYKVRNRPFLSFEKKVILSEGT
jgi:hypothetical protein